MYYILFFPLSIDSKQDPHHYETTRYSGTPIPSVRQNDDILKIVENRGETLIIVPCWWDGTASSLQASIYFQRPDLFNERPQGVPISLEPPQGHFSSKYIPEVGELMLASTIYTVFDPHNWWLGEIYIGIRGCWNPVTAKVYSRNHSEISIPNSFKEHLGGEFLDGVFWFGRSTMQQYAEMNLLNFRALMKYVAFDVFNSQPFESRYETCLNSVDKFNQLVTIAPVVKCKTLHHMNTFLTFICDEGGEGIVCREPTSLYQPGNSESLKKIKKSVSQQYALVTEMSQNQYCATLPNGISFSSELSPALSSQISVGDVVKVSFSYLYRGKPVEPVISLIDEEIQWESIIQGQKSLQGEATSLTTSPISGQKMPFGHWTSSSDNVRVFFDGIAEKHNFDPLVADNWYTFSGDIVRSEQSGGSILTHYNGSFVKALLDVYPNIGLEPSRFATVTKHFWSIPDNRRKFFEKIAQRLGFDPLIPDNWYSFDKSEVNNEKGCSSVMSLYGGSIVKALVDTYPEVNFDKMKFSNIATRSFNPIRRREILDAFASKNNFDPNVPESWYSIDSSTLKNSKDLALLLRVCYANSLLKALKDVYPSLRFDDRKFESRRHWHWHKLSNRKAFFDSFAAKNGFDPLNMDKWRSVRVLTLLRENGGRALMSHYSNSLMKALNEVYPSLKLDEKFGVKPKFFWAVADNRRIFFDKLATSRGCDPLLPSTWYNFSRKELISVKGGAAILGYFSNSLANTLMYTYPDIGLDKERLEPKKS